LLEEFGVDDEAAVVYSSRLKARAAVRNAVFATSSQLTIVGSWARGDFHLRNGKSFSDVDTLGAGHSDADLARLQGLASTSSRRMGGLIAGMSVHSDNHFVAMPLEQQKWFNLAEYWIAMNDGRAAERGAYATAKAALLVGRSNPTETYADVASRLGGIFEQFLAVKLGLIDPMTPWALRDARKALAACSSAHSDRLSEWLVERPGMELRADLLAKFQHRPSEEAWISHRISAKIQSVSNSAC
ncbi:MAG: hypothetical protein WBP38_07480, partial [Hyphomicrobium sp.]